MDMYQNLFDVVKKHNLVVIMTHKNPDLDGFSSSICMSYMLNKMGIESRVFLGETERDISVIKAMKELEKTSFPIQYIHQEEFENLENVLLLVLDVNKDFLLEYPEILQQKWDTVVIDHHIKDVHYIKDTVMSYVNANASSIVEIMVGYLQYLGMNIPPLLATILLAGMEIDTNSFNVKTTAETFLSAAYLMSNGADTIKKQEILKEVKSTYIKKQYFIKNSRMINEKMALCVLDQSVYSNKFLASLSEDLLQFENVEASFTIGKLKDQRIGISARSLGNINVLEIIRRLGGGGHLTEAATQIENQTIAEVEKQLLSVIEGGNI